MDKDTICPLCASQNFSFVFNCTDHLVSHNEYGIASCDSCGFRITQNMPDSKDIGYFYGSKDYISHSDTRKALTDRLYHLSRDIMLHRKASLVKRFSDLKRGKLLDIGSGTGYFAAEMRNQLWDVSAVELNEAARIFCKNEFDIDPHSNLDDLIDSGKKSFNAITLWHVLEHIEDLDSTMLSLHKLLAHDGVLVLALPNFASFDARKYQENWAAYDVPRHIWHFSKKQLDILSAKYGFRIISTKKMPLDAFYISMMSEKQQGRNFHFARGIMTGLRAYFAALFDREQSSSLIYFLKKV